MALAGIDQQHLACSDLTALLPIVEQEASPGDDQSDRYRVAVGGNGLARLEPQTDDAHRAAVCDLLEAKRAWGIAGVGP
jgi:hypothetical protein